MHCIRFILFAHIKMTILTIPDTNINTINNEKPVKFTIWWSFLYEVRIVF